MTKTKLYIKQHIDTGLLYFGKTIKDISKYSGSGKYWLNHLHVHGKNVRTLWCSHFESEDLLEEFALFFSEEMDIVQSDRWANLKPENGRDGTIPGAKLSDEHRAKLAFARRGKKHSPEAKAKISLANSNPSDETRQRKRMAQTGSKHSQATRIQMSLDRKGKPASAKRHSAGYNKTKIGKKVFVGPLGERQMFFLNEQPCGWVLKCERLRKKYV